MPPNGGPSKRQAVLHLQRTIGNQATGRLLRRLAEQPSPPGPGQVQRKLIIGRADDPYEREADAAARRIEDGQPVDRISRLPAGGLAPRLHRESEADEEEVQTEPVQCKCDACKEEERVQRQTEKENDEPLQMQNSGPEAALDTDRAAGAMARTGTGSPLEPSMQAKMEQGFGADFSGVRVHTGSAAKEASDAINARAFTRGSDIYIGRDASPTDHRLMAHELTHVVQQVRGPRRAVVMRQPAAAQQAPVRQTTVEEAAEFLEDMTRFIEGARSHALVLTQSRAGAPTTAARRRALSILNQKRLREMLANARQVFTVQESALQGGEPNGTRLRTALLGVVAKIREVAPVALGISDGMPAPTPDAERRLNAQLVVELIETDPFTSAGMVGTPAFGAAETRAGASHEAFIEAYLDDLIRTLPGQTLAPAARDRILARISAGLRRAFLTVGTGTAGTPDVRAITNPRIVGKYRRVNELLSAAMSARPAQLNIITDPLPAYVLPPDPVPNVMPQLKANPNIDAVDLSRVPAIELPYVLHGVLQAARVIFPAASTVQRRNASWPVALQVRRGGNIVRVHYDLIFDATSNLRVERLGEAGPREVTPAFAQLAVPGKKAQLIADFGLAGVDDRPAAPGRPAAAWTSAELDQVKAAYDLIPAGDRAALRGVTIVRDHHGPPPAAAGQVLLGFAHTSASPAHDAPGPPPHGPPHIHYYDDAFAKNAITAVGGPGSSGPGADWTVAHEVGHFRIFLAIRQANAAITAANAQNAAAGAGLPALNAALPQAQHQVRQAYGQARNAANAAIQALNAAVIANPPATPAQRAPLLQAAQAAVAARNQARANLAANVPAAMVAAATNLDAAQDALLAATQSLGTATDQIPTFIALAGTFGFTPFTDYARRGGNDEFFSETYALYLTDPNRLSGMNRSIFLWFEAGMPMNPAWRPPP